MQRLRLENAGSLRPHNDERLADYMFPRLLSYADRLRQALNSVDEACYETAVRLLVETADSNGRVWILGNGGSAAISDHFATDLFKVGIDTGVPYRATSLASNSATLTATANDYGFECSFAHQIGVQGAPGDVVVAISSSGNSPNVLEAVTIARAGGLRTVGMAGFDGGKLVSSVDFPLLLTTALGDYGIAEDGHSALCHSICENLRGYASN